ncbi:MAG: glycerol-3-phosphate 1-O-acyltransferase PlsY [Cucumibacter sp.]
MPDFLIAAIAGYLLGSIPFGLLITRAAGLGDIRKIGSGNIGATNVLRTGRRELAALTLLLDAGKGAAAVLLARYFLTENAAMVAGLAAFLGHNFPIWLGFKGGKGVATYIGVMLGLNWIVGALFCIIWLIVAFARRYSSLAALTAAAATPVFAWIWSGPELAGFSAAFALLIYYRHWPNIRRLVDGTETRIGETRPASTAGGR